jgi:hypothetical protein
MPNNIVIAQADAPAEAGIEAQVQAQVQELVNEIRVPPDFAGRDSSMDSPFSEAAPIVLFLAIAAVFCVKYYLNYRAKQDVQATVRAALERGVPTGEILDRMVDTPPPKGSDLRRGAIWLALGVGIAAFGFTVDFGGDTWQPMLAIGLVPILLGAAYLVLWRLGDGKA